VIVHPATADDAGAVHALHAECFPDLHAGLLGDVPPPAAQRRRREESWTGPIGAPHERHALLVARRDTEVVGFTAVGPTRDADRDRTTTGELRTVMVSRGERGRGTGAALLAAGEQAMRAAGFTLATLWVLPENHAARRCYERAGWTPDGSERVSEHGGRAITAVRYEKRLAGQPSRQATSRRSGERS
jgi:GNAT superfamily N-acetyltransferase